MRVTTDPPRPETEQPTPSIKKPYAKPTVVALGAVSKLTCGGGTVFKPDGQSNMSRR